MRRAPMQEIAGNYRILGLLGSGGMGSVYRAGHVLIGRPAAIKVLAPELAADRVIVARFFDEARAASTIRHAGVVEIFDFDYLDDGRPYIAMELLSGQSLAERIKARGRLP